MRYGSVCSGIEAASVAWGPLGWRPAFFAEIEPFPCAVLAHHHPDVPNLGDMTTINGADWRGVDVLVGGTPCQSFSIAGLRGSLSDARGNLSLAFVRLAHAIPALLWVVWENVPGVLNTDDNAFGCFLAGLVGADDPLRSPLERGRWPDAGMVAGPRARAAWRVLDAQYFGLAQRRQRVFVVAGLGDGTDPAAVLFEPKGMRRDPAESAAARAETAGTLGGVSADGGWRVGADEAAAGQLVAAYRTSPNSGAWETGDRVDALTTGTDPTSHVVAYGGNRTSGARDVASAVNAKGGSGRMDFETETFVVNARQDPLDTDGTTYAVAVHENQHGELTLNDTAGSLKVAGGKPGQGYPAAMVGTSIRRLAPVECARLQGFPDNYLDIPYRGKPAADGPKYKALGNSMAVPCMAWIGRRIQEQDAATC